MSELYWITRLDGLQTLFAFLLSIGIIGTIVLVIMLSYLKYEEDKNAIKILTPFYKMCIIFLVIGIPGKIFTPTTEEAYIIYGIGGTIDYIKSNDTAKQIPDKCIIAIDKLLDEYLTPEQEENKEEN